MSAENEPLRSIDGGLAEERRRARTGFDAEFQHQRRRYRPFYMDRVELHLRRSPSAYRWEMYLLLHRVDDKGWWKGRRKTLAGILGLSDRTFTRCMHELAGAYVATNNWRGDGTGWVRITGFLSLWDDSQTRQKPRSDG